MRAPAAASQVGGRGGGQYLASSCGQTGSVNSDPVDTPEHTWYVVCVCVDMLF